MGKLPFVDMGKLPFAYCRILEVVIFVKSVQRAIALDKLLCECNFPSIAIHSALDQEERIGRYKQFKESPSLPSRRSAFESPIALLRHRINIGYSTSYQILDFNNFRIVIRFQKRIMVATDLFGRGIDIERVNIVINYDVRSPDAGPRADWCRV